MTRVIVAGWLMMAAAGVALADHVTLSDGRTFVGTVKVDGDTVFITTSNATLSFPKDQILRIEEKLTPEEEFAKKLADTRPRDPSGLFALAQWAAANGLDKQALDLCNRIITLSADHSGARKMLAHVKIDGQWQPFAKAIEIARGKLDADRGEAVLKDLIPQLKELANTKEKLQALRDLQGTAQLRGKDFAAATQTFATLAESSESPASVRYAAIVEILKANPDGMFVLDEPYPPAAGILGEDKTALKAGPVSLSDPLALQAALHARAKKEIDAGRKVLEAAARAAATDADVAKTKYGQALQIFDRADAIEDGISKSWRIEIARRRIAAIRKDSDNDAERFDKAMSKLGKTNVSPQEYQNMILNLIRLLDNVRDNLQAIVNAAKPFPKELVLELKWAELDLKKTESMRKILLDELSGSK